MRCEGVEAALNDARSAGEVALNDARSAGEAALNDARSAGEAHLGASHLRPGATREARAASWS